MDTNVRKTYALAGCREPGPGFARLALMGGGCTLVLLLFGGCELFKAPAPSNDVAIRSFFKPDTENETSPAPTGAAPPPPARTGTRIMAAPRSTPARTASPAGAQSPSPPSSQFKSPTAEPARGAEKLIAAGPAAFPAERPDSAGHAASGTVSSSASGPLIVKGPPLVVRRASEGKVWLVLPALGLVALVGGLAIYSQRRRRGPGVGTKNNEEGLSMPGEFKVKDSIIQGPIALGVLAPEPRRGTSILVHFLNIVALACSKLAAVYAYVVSSSKSQNEEADPHGESARAESEPKTDSVN